ncbi:MAG: hypothetical protein KIS76_18200 [Pyrinomonadaceae bacterium]|nr:hypothetical protein [Pyrinomonadaceae bacterium]
MSKKLQNFIPTILFLGILLFGNACTTDTSPNRANNAAANNSNSGSSDKTAAAPCLNLEELKRSFPESIAKQVGSNFIMSYEPLYKVLTIKGAAYSHFEEFRDFIGALNDSRNETCVRMITFEGKEEGKEFRWCSNIDCSAKVPDQVKCSENNIKALYKDVAIGDQIGANQLKPAFNQGNDGKMVLKGRLRDKPKDKLTSFLEGIQKEVGDCITTFSFAYLPADNSDTSRSFEWQLCEFPDCECLGECRTQCPCTKTMGNSNTNVGSKTP